MNFDFFSFAFWACRVQGDNVLNFSYVPKEAESCWSSFYIKAGILK